MGLINQSKKVLGPLWLLAVFFFASLCWLTFARLGLNLWQSDRVFTEGAWHFVFIGGLRVYIATLCYIITPALLLILAAHALKLTAYIRGVVKWYLVIMAAMLVFFEVITPTFINEYDLRPNRLFIEYLIYPKEVSKMIFSGYKLEVLFAVLALVFTIKFANKILTQQWHNRSSLGAIKL